MARINYSFGSGTCDVFISLKTGKISSNYTEMHALYGGKQYYSSRSGASGAGFFVPIAEQNDLLKLPGYRAGITYLSEAWPETVLGTKIMVPVEGIEHYPAVAEKDGRLFFLTSASQVLLALQGQLPNDFNKVNYKYLNENFEEEIFTVEWAGNMGEERNGSPRGLPYSFEEFVSLFLQLPNNIAKISEQKIGFIEQKMNLQLTEDGRIVQTGYLGLPKEVVEGELFPETPRSWAHNWVTQSFSKYEFVYKRVSSGNKVYAIIQAIPEEINKKYSILGPDYMEYELIVENVAEWFSKPIEEWVEQLKAGLTTKIRNQFVDTSRWSIPQAKNKVRELLQQCSDKTLFVTQDSLDTGNCLPGTENFMQSYGLENGMTCNQILKHKKFEEMIDNGRFRAVIIYKLYDAEPEENSVVYSTGGDTVTLGDLDALKDLKDNL